MEIVSKKRWMQALFQQQNGGRLNQMLSLMTGGFIEYVEWNQMTALSQWDATGTVHFRYQELPDDPVQDIEGLIAVTAYASMEDFSQDNLVAQLQWLQEQQKNSDIPVRLLLLAFCRDNFDKSEQPGMLTEEQWEELLNDGIAMALGMPVQLAEVIVLPMVAYQKWLQEV